MATLEKFGDLKILEGKDTLIGSIIFFRYDKFENNFVVADRMLKDLKIINPKGKIIKVVGKHGNGPGEFQRIARLAVDKNYYYVGDDVLLRVSKFSKDTGYINSFKLPGDISFNGMSMEIHEDNIFISTWHNKYRGLYDVYKVKPISVFNQNGELIKNIGCYDDKYRKMAIYDLGVCFDFDENGFIYFTNEQSWKVFKYDISNNNLITFGIKGNNFLEQKESIRGDEDHEQIRKLSLRISTVQAFYVSDFIYFQYTNNTEEFIKTRSRTDQHHYLMVYTKDGKYIKSDIKLPGFIRDVDDNGIIYIELSDEPGNRIIGKYKLKIIDEN